MLVRCPTCASGYELAPEMLPAGQILRCAHCRDAWVHAPPARAEAPGGAAAAGVEIVAAALFSRRALPPAAAMPRAPERRAGRLPRP